MFETSLALSDAIRSFDLTFLTAGALSATGLLHIDDISAALAAAPLLAGDYNEDGNVDAADYVVWRKTGSSQAGYDLWRANFGRTVGAATGTRHTATPGAGSAAPVAASSPRLGEPTAAVPEPGLMTLLFTGVVLHILWRRPSVALRH
jgi:hypothetical protein